VAATNATTAAMMTSDPMGLRGAGRDASGNVRSPL
jgi:hypothetical protein